MNKQQKDYTIKEISKYNEKIDKLYFGINRNSILTFCGVGLAVAIFAMNNGELSGNEIFDNCIGTSSVGFAVYNGIKAVQKICERSSLQHTVRILEHQTVLDELEKPKQLVKDNHLEILDQEEK